MRIHIYCIYMYLYIYIILSLRHARNGSPRQLSRERAVSQDGALFPNSDDEVRIYRVTRNLPSVRPAHAPSNRFERARERRGRGRGQGNISRRAERINPTIVPRNNWLLAQIARETPESSLYSSIDPRETIRVFIGVDFTWGL